jgi:hypothetical protein
MIESLEQKIESGQDSRVTNLASQTTSFEPEVLAFCCEH